MRVAALYDIHGNLPALEAVLAELEREPPDVIVCGGDVGPGPMLTETIERLRGLSGRVRFVLGNADREVIDAFERPRERHEPGAVWCAQRLDRAGRDFLAGFEPGVVLDVDGLGPTCFCHGSPRSDTDVITLLSDPQRIAPMLSGVPERTIVCGHTHSQFDRVVSGRRVVNAGSVGIPYEGVAGAFWLRLGPGVQPMRTAYDVDAAIAALAITGFPEVAELLRESLIEPISAETAAWLFEQQLL